MKNGNKIAVITGSAGGLGKEFAENLLSSGHYRVCISDVNETLGTETCKSLAEKYGPEKVHFQACDVTDLQSVDQLWTETISHFKADAIDLWVNNAGVMGEKEGWKKCLDINLTGVLNGIHVTTSKSRPENEVTIVNVASILGLFNAQQPKGWAYNTSKSAVVTTTRCMASAFNNVRMLCLCPSVTLTPILKDCSKEEVEEMSKQVGGLMNAAEVGKAFLVLLEQGRSGDVMALWNDCPPYFIPDTSMGLFIAFTICAMAFRFTPTALRPVNGLRPFPHMFAVALLSVVLMWSVLGQLTVWMGSV